MESRREVIKHDTILWLRQQHICIVSLFWRLKVQIQGPEGVDPSEACEENICSRFPVDLQIAVLSLHLLTLSSLLANLDTKVSKLPLL